LKAEILKNQVLENLSDIEALEVINGMTYLLSPTQSKLICLDPYLNLKYQIELPGYGKENTNSSLTSFYINDYPHLFAIEFCKEKNLFTGWLIKLPTPYNRKHLVWQKELSDWYMLFEMHEDFSVQEPAIKTTITGSDYFALISEGKNTSRVLYFNKKETLEYFQGHTESAPFPQLETLKFAENTEYTLELKDCLVYKDWWFGLSKNEKDEGIIHHRESQQFENIRGQETTPLAIPGQQTFLTKNSTPYTGQLKCFGITENPESGIFMAVAIEQLETTAAILLIEITID